MTVAGPETKERLRRGGKQAMPVGGLMDDNREIHRNPLLQQRWLFTADKIARDPSLLQIPLANIERWIAAGELGNIAPLLDWRSRIEAAQASPEGMRELLELMRDDGEEAWYLKSCTPFPGVLSRNELDQFRCAWVH